MLGKYKGLPIVDHAGGDAGYRSDMTRFPEQHFSAAVLCNSGDTGPTGLVHQVADIVLAKDFTEAKAPAKEPAGRSTVSLTAAQMEALAGVYWNRDDDEFVRVTLKDGKLEINPGGDEIYALKAAGESRFHIADVPWGDDVDIHFVSGVADKPRRLEQSFGGQKPTAYELAEAFMPSGSQLAEYTGAYVSEEIDPVYRILLQDGTLKLVRLKEQPETLRPTVRDFFSGNTGSIRFTRDANQRISGFILNAGRIRNFRFSKKGN